MQHFWSVFGLFSERSRGTPAGFPRPPGGSPSPSKSPPEGGNRAPQGAGACRPPVSPSGSPSTPLGHPCGVPPPSGRLPLLPLFGNERGWQAKRAGAVAPERGWKKIKVAAPIAAAGRQRWKCGEGGAVGGQGWGQPVGSPWAVHGVSLLLSTDRRSRPPVAQRSPHLHRPGVQLGPLWGPIRPWSGGQTIPGRPSWSGSRPAFS